MTCANCNNDAVYVYPLTSKTSVLYCEKHLPSFLESRKKAGLLQTTASMKAAQEEAISALTTPAPVEETPAPAPRPTKAAKKTAQ